MDQSLVIRLDLINCHLNISVVVYNSKYKVRQAEPEKETIYIHTHKCIYTHTYIAHTPN